MQRITVTITDEQAAQLKDEQLKSGAPVSLQIRRALNLALFAEQQSARDRSIKPVLVPHK
jgi:hypothetical protein